MVLVGHIESSLLGLFWLFCIFHTRAGISLRSIICISIFFYCTYYTFNRHYFHLIDFHESIGASTTTLADIGALLDALTLSTAGVDALQAGALLV